MEQKFDGLQFNQNLGRDLQAREVARGQKIVIVAVLLNVLALAVIIIAPAYDLSPELGGALLMGSWAGRILAYLLGIYGVLKIGGGLDWSGLGKFLLFIALLLPLINLITLLAVNSKATAFLKSAGYKVGLAGAYK